MIETTESIQNYLKAIHALTPGGQSASTTDLAARLGIAPASVTGMIQKMAAAEPPLVTYRKHQGVTLTPEGERTALEVIRHHRLIETYLVVMLGYSWDNVHEEACRLEHVISEEFEDRIAAHLGNPLVDPHGDPIPAKDGTIVAVKERALLNLQAGESASITRVADGGPEMLRYAASLGLTPTARLTLMEAEPFGGSLRVKIGKAEKSIGRELAAQIFVTDKA